MAIKTITVFECSDKRRFDSEESAFKHAQEYKRVQDYLRQYTGTKRPETNGGEYVQHDVGTRAAMVALYKQRGVHPRADEDSHSPWAKFYWRLAGVDVKDREWGQPYFANHATDNARAVVRVP